MSVNSPDSKKTERFSMPKLEIVGYEVTDVQDSKAEDYAEKRGCSYFSACQELGYKPIYAQDMQALTEKDKAQSTLDAIDCILRVSKTRGMIIASESSHPRFSGYNKLTDHQIDNLEYSEQSNIEAAKNALRKAIGSQALKALGFNLPAEKVTDQDFDALFNDIYDNIVGSENRTKREKMRRELTKIIINK